MLKSISFKRSIGVFEGGGMRGAAFAGAYDAATEAGITFAGTVGASAGSIAAVLIAAGLSVEEVRRQLSIDFSELLTRATPPPSLSGRFKKWLLSRLGKGIDALAAWNYSLGIYSSKELEEWINRVLNEKLPHVQQPVRFKDLPKPVAILASDLLTNAPKIFSTHSTPNSSVGFAVRASCSIPIFFQPVRGEATLLVDGGLLSNLPVFLVSELDLQQDIPSLCFRLNRSHPVPEPYPEGGIELLKSLVNTAISGATEVQLNMGPSRQVVDIDTGDVNSTDFHLTREQLDALYVAGKTAVEEFVRNEQTRISVTPQADPEIQPRSYREGLLMDTMELISTSAGDIWIIAGDLSWLRELHVSLLDAALNQRNIRIICETPPENSAQYREAIKGAVALGALVVETQDHIPIKGTIVSAGTEAAKMLLVEKHPRSHGQIYKYSSDRRLLELIMDLFQKAWEKNQEGVNHNPVPPVLEAIGTGDLIDALKKGVHQYRDLHIKLEPVALNELSPLPLYLETFKLKRAKDLSRLLVRLGLPNAARYKGSPWIITPPVVEKLKNDNMVVIDGNHRVFHALSTRGAGEIRALVVENDRHQLPATHLQDWEHIQVYPYKLERLKRYRNFNSEQFREIREAFKKLALE